MPIYLYRNLATGETFEYEQKIMESALTAHPETGEPVKRLIQPVGISFKGSGFYINDARKSHKAPPKPKDASPSDSPSSTGAATSTTTGAATDAAPGPASSAPSSKGTAGSTSDGA